MSVDLKNSRVIVTGGRGLVGSAFVDYLKKLGNRTIYAPPSSELDLCDFEKTKKAFADFKPDYVFHFAGYVFGIGGNMAHKGMSYLKNTMINTNTVEAARQAGVKKIIAMGSGCVYGYPPVSQPMKVEDIFSGPPHFSEDSYAHAKRGMLAQLAAYKEEFGTDYTFVVSCNLYGPRDQFDTEKGHVVASLVKKFYEAKQSGGKVNVWGDGSAQRDFIYVDDAAEAVALMAQHISGPVNLGSGRVFAIREIVEGLCDVTGIGPERIVWDASKPNGQAYRSYDLTALQNTGFKAHTGLKVGLQNTYNWYAEKVSQLKVA